MALTAAAKAALCICPPALMAGTVATVPPVKRAVHHLTAPRHAAKSHRPAAAKVAPRPQTVAQQQAGCEPMDGGTLPAVPLVTYAAPLPDEPGSGLQTASFSTPGLAPVIGGIAAGAPSGTTSPVVPVTPATPAGAVPEPSVWLMMIVGAGTLGGLLRRRRRHGALERRSNGLARKTAMGGLLWSGSAAVEAGDMAATIALKSTVASVAGKAVLCVCPAAIVAGTVMTVPPVRQAVYAATLPAEAALAPPSVVAPLRAAQPCPEVMTVPVAATSVGGFPPSVETVTNRAAKPTDTITPAATASIAVLGDQDS